MIDIIDIDKVVNRLNKNKEERKRQEIINNNQPKEGRLFTKNDRKKPDTKNKYNSKGYINELTYFICADFETTIDEPVKVYKWYAHVKNIDVWENGNDIQSFIEFIHKYPKSVIWFHNADFDGSYILDYLVRKGVIHNGRMIPNHYEYVMGEFKDFTYYWDKDCYCNVLDSISILSGSLKQFGKIVGLKKGDTKENAFYTTAQIEEGLSRVEENKLNKYCKLDVKILSKIIDEYKLIHLFSIAQTKAKLAYDGLTKDKLFTDEFIVKPKHQLIDIEEKQTYQLDLFIDVINKQNKKKEYFKFIDWIGFSDKKKRNYIEISRSYDKRLALNPDYIKMNDYKNSMIPIKVPLEPYLFYKQGIKYERFSKKSAKRKKQIKELNFNNSLVKSSYKGGLNYVNPKYQNQWLDKRIYQYDINSMYPWIYSSFPMPDSLTRQKVDNINKLDLGIIVIKSLKAKCKDDKFPLLKLKTDTLYAKTGNKQSAKNIDEYCYEFYYDNVFSITNMEYQYLLENYDIENIEILAMYKYERNYLLETAFKDYCKYWYNQKKIARDKDDGVKAYFAKLMLNSVYGKFGQYGKQYSEYHYEIEDNTLTKIETNKTLDKFKADVLVASYITGYGRVYLANAINNIRLDNFVYCDTDSIHCFNSPDEIESKIKFNDLPNNEFNFYNILSIKGIGIGKELGEFKLEGHSDLSKYIQNKTYGHIFTDYSKELKDKDRIKWKTICAGFDDQIPIDEFEKGMKVKVRRAKLVNGGKQIIEQYNKLGAKVKETEFSSEFIDNIVRAYKEDNNLNKPLD